ncbi:reverse transcriptase domain-containing protein [Tanacetum coccineum]
MFRTIHGTWNVKIPGKRRNVAIHPEYPEQTIAIGSTLTEKGHEELCALLRQNLDVFAWKPADMTGVPQHMVEHRLNVREGCPPVKQKKRRSPLSQLAIQPGHGQETRWELANVCGFQRSKQSMPSGRFILAEIDWKEGMFLGYKVNAEGLKVCPDKADTVLSLSSLGCLKDVQKLNGKLARSRSSLQTDEETHSETPNANCTKGKEGANHIPSRGQGSYQRSLNDRKGRQAISSLLCEPCPMRAEDQLHPHGKIGIRLAQRKQTAEKTLFTDGSSCIDGSRAGLILTNLEGVEFTYAMRFRFEATNNEAEYEALIAGLRIAEQMGYLEKVQTLASNFKEFSIKQVPRSENKKADALSKIVSTSFAHLSKQVLVKELNEKYINKKEVLAIVEEEGQTWMTPICEYLTKEILPKDKKKARVVRRKASQYTMINGTLYKKYFLGPWLRFGLPGEIVSNNEKQFRDNPFKDWCEKLCIHQCFASVKHTQANGLVKRANMSLGEGIKARLDERKVISAEIGVPTLRTAEVDLMKNDKALEINLDLIEEKREEAAIQEAKSKAKMEKYYNSKV